MKLNHLNLAVPDVTAARDFLQKYFGLRSVGCGKGGHALAVLVDDGGLVLTLSNFDGATGVRYPGSFHIGFIQESRARVDEINQRLRDDGFDVGPPGKGHGAWTFYFQAPGGFTVEVLSDLGPRTTKALPSRGPDSRSGRVFDLPRRRGDVTA